MKHTIKYVALFIMLLGCQKVFCQKEAMSQIVDPFDNKVWLSELEKDTAEMKASWFKVFTSSIRDNTDGGLKIFQKGDDPSTMKVIPVVSYVISLKSLLNWNETVPIERLLELSKKTTTCYMVDGKNIKCCIDYKLKDNKWVAVSFGRFGKETAAMISSVYFEKNECLIYINVELDNGENPHTYFSPVYKENGNYITLNKYSTDSPLFINSLITLRRNKIRSMETGDFM